MKSRYEFLQQPGQRRRLAFFRSAGAAAISVCLMALVACLPRVDSSATGAATLPPMASAAGGVLIASAEPRVEDLNVPAWY